jgi:hypothetical protein
MNEGVKVTILAGAIVLSELPADGCRLQSSDRALRSDIGWL